MRLPAPSDQNDPCQCSQQQLLGDFTRLHLDEGGGRRDISCNYVMLICSLNMEKKPHCRPKQHSTPRTASDGFHARALKKLFIYDVKHLSSLENFVSVVHLDVFRNTDLERISNLPKLQKLVIVECPKLKVLVGMPALQRLILLDYNMETVPRYLQDVNPRNLLLYCSLSLLTCIAAGKSGPVWDKFSHIQQVKAYADDEGIPRKRYVLYTRDQAFHFKTNISHAAIVQARNKRTWFAYTTCPIEDEWPVGQRTHAEKRQPLCLRFRCNAYRHLAPWLRRACLHCSEAQRIASSSDQWTEATGYAAYIGYLTRYGRLQQQRETSSV